MKRTEKNSKKRRMWPNFWLITMQLNTKKRLTRHDWRERSQSCQEEDVKQKLFSFSFVLLSCHAVDLVFWSKFPSSGQGPVKSGTLEYCNTGICWPSKMTVMGLGLNPSPPGHSVLYSAVTQDQPKHIWAQQQQQQRQITAVTHVLWQDLTATAGWWQSDLTLGVETQTATLHCVRFCCFFFSFSIPHQSCQDSQFSTEPSGLNVTTVTQSYKVKSSFFLSGRQAFPSA